MVDQALKLDGKGPLYEQIRKAIAGKITNHDWRPGDRIPIERELVKSLNTSRMTVNRALRALADDGIIVRRRKAGSFVAEQSVINAPLTISSAETEITAAGASYTYELLSKTFTSVPPGHVAADRIAPETKVLRLLCRHLGDGRPVMLEDRWINTGAVPAAFHETFEHTAPGTWLLRHVPWNEAEHVIAAIGADDQAARLLKIRKGTPCLSIERRTWTADATITGVRLIYPGSAKKLIGRFYPAKRHGCE